ncbi:MAG TPA: type II and III secretion system protein, partial [Chthoniobacteraceae bacterium]|nr:type II and III secretion system protein [Chthoniobacteraceae bacterium]
MIRHSLASTAALLVAVSVITPTFAGPTGYETTTTTTSTTAQGAAARELARRYDRSERIGREAIAAGDRAMHEKDYETAFAQYKLACDNIPNSPNTRHLYHRALDGMCDAGVKLAEQRIAEGRYADAEATLKIVLSEQYDPRCREAVVILARLETPGYYNRTITPKFRANVEEVKRLLLEADGFYETGRYDLAFKRYEQVLNIDPYNVAARKGEEKVNLAREHSALAGYNEARSRAMWKLDLAWSNPVRKFGARDSFVIDNNRSDAAGTQRIQTKLNQIIIPRLEFREASIREAVEYLRKRSIELDNTGIEPRGVNIV